MLLETAHLALDRFLCGSLFFVGCKECVYVCFFCFQLSFCPVKRGNRAGSARNESGYSRRGTQISFPLLEGRSCDIFYY